MIKMDINLIKKYVSGEDLGIYSLEQLEGDKDFMMGVISYTNDYKIYYLCSDDLKINYDFVKFLLFKFKDNSDFIIKVCDYYLDHTDADLERIELGIIIEKILPNSLANKYKIINETTYFTKRLEIEIAKARENELESEIGMGFLLIYDQYNGNNTILDYYSSCMLDEIIKDNNINFEKMLHNQFKSADKITEMGINNYIINFISCYDSMLSSYISTHLGLISHIVKIIRNVQSNWNKFTINDERTRYNKMFEMVHEYMGIAESNMQESELLYFVAKELGIKDKVTYYDNQGKFDEEYDLDFDDELIDDSIKYELRKNLRERLVYSNVRKIMINQIFSNNPSDLYSIIDEDSDKTSSGSGKRKNLIFDQNNQ